ncbi:cytochrome P450 [Mycena sp. CBHHK59/15]|nr:cytochrome P450 [Mycena sp. CBHHK59/15]
MDDTRLLVVYGLAAVVSLSWLRSASGPKSPIPAIIGSDGVLSYYRAAYRYLLHATDVVQLGYSTDREGIFRVPRLFRWDFVGNGAKRAAEVAAAPENVLSFYHGVADDLQVDYTMGPEISANPYHAHTIRTSLTRNLGRCFPEVRDEIVCSFDDVLALNGADWKMITVLPEIMKVVARTSNRLFVGLPLCREQEYLDLAIDYTVAILGPLISTRKSSMRHALKFLGPMIEERLAKDNEQGRDWPGRPNDLISWLLDIAEGPERTAPALTLRVLATNMAAIHTSSMTLTHALYDLTTYPDHILPMREEAERVVAEEGWTKAALNSMHKIDSFIRESMRLTASGPVAMNRKVVDPNGFKFSDGTSFPTDPNYKNPDVFDGFRFSRQREERAQEADETVFKRHMITTGMDHLVFGHGQHACPGRFFAATELKAMLAHILINYDVKAETPGVRPPDQFFALLTMPNSKGKIWIRKRQ